LFFDIFFQQKNLAVEKTILAILKNQDHNCPLVAVSKYSDPISTTVLTNSCFQVHI